MSVVDASTPGRSYAASTGDAVAPAAYGMALAYLLVALPPVILLPAVPLRPVLAATLTAGAAVCALIGWVAAPRRRPAWVRVHWVAAAIATVPTLTSLVTLVAHETPIETVNLILTLVGATALIHVRRAAVAVALLIVGGWAVVGVLLAPGAVTADSVNGMAMAVVVAVILHVSRQRTVARLESARAEIAAMAVTDELTRLSNRRALFEAGGRAVADAQRDGRDVTVLYIDVDGLKVVNDTQGHAAGDELILSVAAVLRGVFATADVLARTGGDEFAVVLSGYGPGETEMLRVRLAAALRQAGASASCGAAHLRAGDRGVTLDQLLDRADLSMYTEKASRRAAGERRDGERRGGLAAS